MTHYRIFFQCVGEALVSQGLHGLIGALPLGTQILEVAQDTYRRLREHQHLDQLRNDVQEMAVATMEEIRTEAKSVTLEVAQNCSTEEQEALTNYLLQIPPAIRRTCQSPRDPSGRTIPLNFQITSGRDLLAILPLEMPRFKSGDAVPGMTDWILDELLGVGGFGEVWLAHHIHFQNTRSAFKFCLNQDLQHRLLQHEASILNQVMQHGNHPGIVPLLDAKLNQNPPWLRYEFIDGGNLRSLNQLWKELPSGEQQSIILAVILDLARIVKYFHQLSPQIVHRDLKPENILLQYPREGGYRLRIADFGIGNLVRVSAEITPTYSASRRSERNLGVYSHLYSSPQQMRGEAADPKDDIYALGVIWYQLILGDFQQPAPTGLRWVEALKARHWLPEIIEILADCIEIDPQHRIQSASRLVERIEAASLNAQLTASQANSQAETSSEEFPKVDQKKSRHPLSEEAAKSVQNQRTNAPQVLDQQIFQGQVQRILNLQHIQNQLLEAQLKRILSLYKTRPWSLLWAIFPIAAGIAVIGMKGSIVMIVLGSILGGLGICYILGISVFASIYQFLLLQILKRQLMKDFPETMTSLGGWRILRDEQSTRTLYESLRTKDSGSHQRQ